MLCSITFLNCLVCISHNSSMWSVPVLVSLFSHFSARIPVCTTLDMTVYALHTHCEVCIESRLPPAGPAPRGAGQACSFGAECFSLLSFPDILLEMTVRNELHCIYFIFLVVIKFNWLCVTVDFLSVGKTLVTTSFSVKIWCMCLEAFHITLVLQRCRVSLWAAVCYLIYDAYDVTKPKRQGLQIPQKQNEFFKHL